MNIVVVIKVFCKKCYSSNIWKNGKGIKNKQQFVCKDCGYQWREK